MEGLYTLMARVPTWVWIIIGLCVVLPVARAAIRKGAKVLGIAAIVLALLFMFPSIGSAFMDRVGLTYNAEEKSITNRDGTTISIKSFKDIFGTGHGADKLIEKAVEKSKDATYRLDDLQKEIKNLSEVQDGATYARDEN